MANSVDPEQTAPIGAVCSGSTLFVSILNSSVMLGNYFAADDFSSQHFQMHFFLGPLRVKFLIFDHSLKIAKLGRRQRSGQESIQSSTTLDIIFLTLFFFSYSIYC